MRKKCAADVEDVTFVCDSWLDTSVDRRGRRAGQEVTW